MNKKNQIEENIEKFDEEIKERKKLTKETKKKINIKIFENLIYFMLIFLYLISIISIYNNADSKIFIKTNLVCSFLWLFTTLILFEISYKKDDDNIAFHGIEFLSISIVSLFLNSASKLFYNKFVLFLETIIAIYMFFYIVKIIYIFLNEKIKHNKNLSDINSIIKEK